MEGREGPPGAPMGGGLAWVCTQLVSKWHQLKVTSSGVP